MPRKKKIETEIVFEEEKKSKVKKPVSKKSSQNTTKKSSTFSNVFMGLILIVLLIFIAIIYQGLDKMRDDVNNVKQTVINQNEDKENSLQNELAQLKLELAQREMQEFSGLYVNKVYGVEFEIPADPVRESGVIDNGDMIMFGPVKDFGDVQLPEYTLRIYQQENFEEYKQRIKFRQESCPDNSCIMIDLDYQDLAEQRTEALDTIFEERQINGLTVYYYLLEQDCMLPTMLVYNELNDTLYEFQQQCSSDVDASYLMLEKIIEKLVFVN